MSLTNRLRLPEPIVRAISNDSYTKGDADFSVTELLSPPQLVRLRREHAAEIVEDAADRIWSLLGQSVHTIIERASEGLADVLTETTLVMDFEGTRLKGTFDSLTISSGELNDFKVTTVWKLIGGGVPEEWEQQTNIYRWMLHRLKGIDVGGIAVIAILRDWSKREAERRSDYPQQQAVRLEVPVWPLQVTEAFVRSRIDLHRDTTQGCSDEDIWAKPSKWALMKRGRKTAVRLYDTREEAEAENYGNGSWVEYRPGQATRCESYCPVSRFCEQWANDPRRKQPSEMENLFNV
jgi:ABC-type transporter Mla MlaB component